MKVAMISRAYFLSVALAVFPFIGLSHAEERDTKAEAFINLYLSTCMQYTNNLDVLRSRLISDNQPKFPPEQAALFLHGFAGDAWPVQQQGQMGNFVPALPSEKKLCSLHARRASPAEVERKFIALVEKAPPPLVSERRSDKQSETFANGKTRTLAYTWALPNENRKIWFMLTTASSENAPLQALGTVSIGAD